MAVELASAFVTILPDGSRIAPEIKKQFAKADGEAKRAGKQAGDAFASGLGSAKAGMGAEGKQAGDEYGQGVEQGVAGAEGKVKSTMSSIGKAGGLALAAGVGVAAAGVGAAISEVFAREAGSDKLAAQLGLDPARSEELGRVSARLYAGAWGESMEQVNTAVGSVVSSIDGLDRASGGTIEGLTAKALDFATAFETDVSRAAQVAGQVMRTGLAPDADAAFDLLVAGSQRVPTALREDLLDATDEYGQFFAQLGFSGEQAFGVLVEGSQKGMYGLDKAGDAIKEFTIRATDMSTASTEAYSAIGLDAETMADKILAGGDAARQGFSQIIDGLLSIESPSARANAAIALFGTPLEDLSVKEIPSFLRSLQGTKGALQDVAGASERMGDTLNDNAQTKITSFKRTLQGNVVDFIGNRVIPALEDFGNTEVGQALQGEFKDLGRELGPIAKDLLPAVGEAMAGIGGALADAAPAAKRMVDAFNGMPDWAKTVLVGGGAAAVISSKLGIPSIGKAAVGAVAKGGVQKVFETNPAALGGGLGKGKVPGVVPGGLPGGKGGTGGMKLPPILTGKMPKWKLFGGAAGAGAGMLTFDPKELGWDKIPPELGKIKSNLGDLATYATGRTGIGGVGEAFESLDFQLAQMKGPDALRRFNTIAEDTGVAVGDLSKVLPSTAARIERAGLTAGEASKRTGKWKDTLIETGKQKPSPKFSTPGLLSALGGTDKFDRSLGKVGAKKPSPKFQTPGLSNAMRDTSFFDKGLDKVGKRKPAPKFTTPGLQQGLGQTGEFNKRLDTTNKKKPSPNFTTPGLPGAISQTGNLLAQLNRIPRTITTTHTIQTRRVGSSGGGPGGRLLSGHDGPRAAGGSVLPGRLYTINERGQEMFAPDVRGQVISNHTLQKATSGGGGGGGRVALTITNWDEGTGYMEYLADDRIAEHRNFDNRMDGMS